MSVSNAFDFLALLLVFFNQAKPIKKAAKERKKERKNTRKKERKK